MSRTFIKLTALALAVAGAVGAVRCGRRRTGRPGDEARNGARTWHRARLARLDHDLRTPIGTIGNAVEWLRSGPSDARQLQETCDLIERQVRRLTTVAAELHELAHSPQDARSDEAAQTGKSRGTPLKE